jgi:hypothetical protein
MGAEGDKVQGFKVQGDFARGAVLKAARHHVEPLNLEP